MYMIMIVTAIWNRLCLVRTTRLCRGKQLRHTGVPQSERIVFSSSRSERTCFAQTGTLKNKNTLQELKTWFCLKPVKFIWMQYYSISLPVPPKVKKKSLPAITIQIINNVISSIQSLKKIAPNNNYVNTHTQNKI